MRSDVFYDFNLHDLMWGSCFFIFKKSLRYRGYFKNVSEYKFILRWRIVFDICCTKCLYFKIFGLFSGIAAHIYHIYLDDDFILYDFERKDYGEKNVGCGVNFDGRGVRVHITRR